MSKFINVHTVTIVATVLAILGLYAFVTDAQASEPSGVFYQWTLPNGDVMVTGDAERIPAKYQDDAIKRSFAQVDKDANFTEVVVPSELHMQKIEDRRRHLHKAAAQNSTSPRVEECNGHLTVSQERRDYVERGNSYNSLFHIVHDACGNEVSVTRRTPLIVVPVK